MLTCIFTQSLFPFTSSHKQKTTYLISICISSNLLSRKNLSAGNSSCKFVNGEIPFYSASDARASQVKHNANKPSNPDQFFFNLFAVFLKKKK